MGVVSSRREERMKAGAEEKGDDECDAAVDERGVVEGDRSVALDVFAPSFVLEGARERVAGKASAFGFTACVGIRITVAIVSLVFGAAAFILLRRILSMIPLPLFFARERTAPQPLFKRAAKLRGTWGEEGREEDDAERRRDASEEEETEEVSDKRRRRRVAKKVNSSIDNAIAIVTRLRHIVLNRMRCMSMKVC